MITLTRAGMFPSKTETLAGKARARFHSATLFVRLHYSTIKKFMRHKKPRTLLRGDEVWAIHEPQGVSA